MSSTADDHNPLLSTPVATIAVDLFKDIVSKHEVPDSRVLQLANGCASAAESLVGVLHERGHLPLKIETEDEPKVDDATLILQGLMLGIVRWVPYGKGDPRGEIYIGGEAPAFEWKGVSKLVKGVPSLSKEMRDVLSSRLAPLLRRV